MLVYKYVHPDRIDVLENGLIRFTQPAALNDPFETFPNFQGIRQALEERYDPVVKPYSSRGIVEATTASLAIKSKVKRKLDELQRELSNDYAFLSLTKKRNNLLMWSHYADSHRGFVIGFDSDHTFFQTTKLNVVKRLEEVRYSATRTVVVPLGLRALQAHERVNLAEAFFYTKSDHWNYEEEMRMIANPKAADKVIEVKGGHNIYLFRFPPECLREVILGYQMEPVVRERIAAIIMSRYPHATLFRAALSETEFDLNIKPVT